MKAERIDLLLSLASFTNRREQAHLPTKMLSGAPKMQGAHWPLFGHRYGSGQVDSLHQPGAMMEEIEEIECLFQIASRR